LEGCTRSFAIRVPRWNRATGAPQGADHSPRVVAARQSALHATLIGDDEMQPIYKQRLAGRRYATSDEYTRRIRDVR
jgi:hypothetical protein